MDFINKLIKKGIFVLIACFSFLVFSNLEKVGAFGSCQEPLINDGDQYLVINTNSSWSDSGVSFNCDSIKQENVSVSINGGAAIETNNSGKDVSNGYLKSAGFYKIKYFLTEDPSVNITRHVRVLPSNLNSVRNIWIGDNDFNTENSDAFNAIIDNKDGYLAVGDFGNSGYIVRFNSKGTYEWHEVYENTKINDVIKSGDVNENIYYLSGQYLNGDNTNKAFVRVIQLNTNGIGINSSYGNLIELENMTISNKMVLFGNYVYSAGYVANDDGSKNGVVSRLTVISDTLTNPLYYTHNIESQYNSFVISQTGSDVRIVAVGTTAVDGYSGAQGGLVTSLDEMLNIAVENEAYYWLNSNGASATTTIFYDLAKYGDNYLVVGSTRTDRIVGENISINSGLDDLFIVHLDSAFAVLDAKMFGSASSDVFYSIENASSNSFIAVGKKSGQGLYAIVEIQENKILVEENTISGNPNNVELRDVFVRKYSDEELQYVFAGSTLATSIEGIKYDSKGNKDAFVSVIDNTGFENFEDINVLQGTIICDESSTTCSSDKLSEKYWLSYGTRKIAVSSSTEISTDVITTYFVYHDFSNGQGVNFKLGRIIIINESPIAPGVTGDFMGIDKWYLYSRPQIIGDNVAQRERLDLWSEYYYPVADNMDKESGVTYYSISGSEFIVDTSDRTYTYENYIKLDQEPQNASVAFQSVEKAKEFALLQEFTRIAFVREKYNYESTGIANFPGQVASLANQNYYFVYYIDLAFDSNTSCGTANNVLYGNCTQFTGYAFANLKTIKSIANSILEKYNYFVSESASRFNPKGSISLPVTEYFKEELYTEKYYKTLSIKLSGDLYLEVKYCGKDTSVDCEYQENEVAQAITGQASVDFSDKGDFKEEGKYTIRYCYNHNQNNVNCGASATFVIDRTAPITMYELTNGDVGSISASSTVSDPIKVRLNMWVSQIQDIDPYAYVMVEGKKYYLRCDANVDSDSCVANVANYVHKLYEYDSTNPDKIFNINVFDRAGNSINAYFKVGTIMPQVSVSDSTGGNSFTLTIDFYNRNTIDSFEILYTQSEECTICANPQVLQEKIIDVINAYIYKNNLEVQMGKEDPEYEPVIVNGYTFIFAVSSVSTEADGSVVFTGGVEIPKVTKEVVDGATVYSFATITQEDGSETIEYETHPVSKGLYKFTIADSFTNTSSAYGGLGLDKAELSVYINSDETIEENTDDISGKFPIGEEEWSEGIQGNVFKAKNPPLYAYIDQLPEDLKNDFNKDMYFTNRFVYVRFKATEFSVIRISKAYKLNTVGNYKNNALTQTEHLNCLFTLYGGSVAASGLDSCDGFITFDEIANYNDELNAQGIYTIGVFNNYYYLAFTSEGTYNIWSELYVTMGESGSVLPALPVASSFTIDTTAPTIDFEVVCKDGGCAGEKNSFEQSDFVFDVAINATLSNLGNNQMKLKFDSDLLLGGAINRLLVVTVNGATYNAYSYSIQTTEERTGNYLLFEASGVYEIIFSDAANNSITYRFIIDNSAPTVDKIEDVNNKKFDEYQQYVEVNVVVSEGSFLVNKEDKNMLTFTFWIEGSSDHKQIGVANENGECKISTGSGLYVENGNPCVLIDNGGFKSLKLSIVLPINKDGDRKSNTQTLHIRVEDYFGNYSEAVQSFIFDNLNPFIYFDSSYNPITDFGKNVTNDDRERMLTTGANASLGNFDCKEFMSFPVGQNEVEQTIINCKDTPENQGKENNIKVQAYEAYRVSFNNYSYDSLNKRYNKIRDGKYLTVQDVVYRKVFYRFNGESKLTEYKASSQDSKKVYILGNYIKVDIIDKIDPNETYYLDDQGRESVTINDMYINSFYHGCDESSDKKCLLYNMYINDGYFAQNQDFYVYDERDYREVSDKTTIDTNDFENYFYTNDTYEVDDGKYLPAVTLENSCLRVNGGKCFSVEANRVKLKSDNDNSYVYYNLINASSEFDKNNVITVTMSNDEIKYVVVDNRIWRIAINDFGQEVRFGFGLASNLGRPIIFRAKDGAGNLSSNYLETVIAIKDETLPSVNKVSSIVYVLDDSGSTITKDNYIKEIKYYKVFDIDNIVCEDATATYYKKNGDAYEEVACSKMNHEAQYYAKVEVYSRVDDGLTKDGGDYYTAIIDDNLNGNYLTKGNMIVEFSEPIYRVECQYYYYNSTTRETLEKNCSFHNTEFNYSEDKRVFQLTYEDELDSNYFVNYSLKVYDFSNNVKTINSLFIDRENPVIDFRDGVSDTAHIEVVYKSQDNDAACLSETICYNLNYKSSTFMSEVVAKDAINNRIDITSGINNEFSYEVIFYAFNYNITYKNYIKDGDEFKPQKDGVTKATGQTYYIRVKNTDAYILKGKDASCSSSDEYCYIEDYYSYYPELIADSKYWIQIEKNEYIKNNSVGVYKVEYKVRDHSGNESDILRKTIYIIDTFAPVINIDGRDSSEKAGYGYHREVTIAFENEREANVYWDRCKDAKDNCVLTREIFESGNADTERKSFAIDSNWDWTFNEESIYKLYFYDKGYYAETVNSDGNVVMTLKYNYIEYTFLIDRTKPEMYINAKEDSNNNLYYEVTLGQEEYLYCVSSNDKDAVLEFGSVNVDCKTLLAANFETTNSNFENMSLVYEYEKDGVLYKLYINNATYYLSVNNSSYALTYKDVYEYDSGTDKYTIRLKGNSYELSINDGSYSSMEEVYLLETGGREYILRIDGLTYTLYIDGSELALLNQENVYVGMDDSENIYTIIPSANGYQLKINSYSEELMRKVYSVVIDSSDYKLIIDELGNYDLHINDVAHRLTHSVTYEVGEYYVRLNSGVYQIKISDGEYEDFKTTYAYTKNSIDYKLVIDESNNYKLHINSGSINENVHTLTLVDGLYVYRDDVNLITYSVRNINGKYQLKVSNEKLIIRQRFDSNSELIYEEIFEKLAPDAQKYFYKTYYYKDGDSLSQYRLGATYDEDNVYIITSIKLVFRNDGKYLIKAQDKSGNYAGRRTSSLEYEGEFSIFKIDNTAPDYNKEQNKPTGINYWYSVPSVVVNSQDLANKVSGISKSSGAKSYDVFTSGLNNSFFYAFATRTEAETYLINIYNAHINSLEDGTCTVSGIKGFNYSYYNPSTGTIDTTCFIGGNGAANKKAAQDKINTIIKSLVYPTFSGEKLFGVSSGINQLACDETVSSYCTQNRNMYKYVYLKIDSTLDPYNPKQTIEEVCVPSSGIECVKINVKIMKNNLDNGNKINLEIGKDNTQDTDSITIFGRSADSSSIQSTSEPISYTACSVAEEGKCLELSLNNNYYYVLVEKDKSITYANYMIGEGASSLTHYNTTYYAFYVDKNEHISVYYEDDYGEGNDLISGGVGTVYTNANEYYLIIKNNGDTEFLRNYEIHVLKGGDDILEVYSYLRLVIGGTLVDGKVVGGTYYNINDYLVKDGNTYYYKIPVEKEKLTKAFFVDMAGNVTSVVVSRSQKAPTIDVEYIGEGKDQTVTVTINDTTLTKMVVEKLDVSFSTNRNSYSTEAAKNIKASLLCKSGQTTLVYGCSENNGSINGINRYSVVISDLENLYGFFKISIVDNHGNTNYIEFIYNPADLTADYTTSNTRYIDATMGGVDNVRMISNDKVQLEWNNKINYMILYKLVDGEYVEVCNSETFGTVNGKCSAGSSTNKVTAVVESGKYLKSVLEYVEEGLYTARIFNRASITINDVCVDDEGVVSTDCTKIKSSSSVECSWENNAEYCSEALSVISQVVSEVSGSTTYDVFEVDKTAPVINEELFVVSTPTGNLAFENNAEYTNAEVKITWNERLVQLSFVCEYTNEGVNQACTPNHTGFAKNEYLFKITNKLSTKYSFWFEDYAGNTTENSKYVFSVKIELPQIAVYEVDKLENGQSVVSDRLVENESKVKNDVKLICYAGGVATNCDIYDVKLEMSDINGYHPMILPDITMVSADSGANHYRYTVSIKNSTTGVAYDNLSVTYVFMIDKTPPTITVAGDKNALLGFYKGSVDITLSEGDGTIYSGCVSTGEDIYGDKIYKCNETPLATFKNSYVLDKTGSYKVIAVDDVGNVTTGRAIKYVTIDNDSPSISIKAKGLYSTYDIAENGFTNVDTVIIQVTDNIEGSYFKYRVKNKDDQYGEWIVHSSDSLEISEAGFYEVVAIDAVGNEGRARHFIIYRSAPKFSVYVENKEIKNIYDILTKDAFVTWAEPRFSYEAPIIKVTMNNASYDKKQVISQTGEYLFVFTDLAGNVTNYKITINKNERICLDKVSLIPKKQYLFNIDDIKISGDEGYVFKENDVIVFATPTNYYGGGYACGADQLSYKILSKESYILLTKSQADYVNKNKNVTITLSEQDKERVKELGSYIYAFVVDKDVAKKKLDLPIGENFFNKDPLGWSLIIVAIGVTMYAVVRLVVFRKKVKVLK